MYKYLTIFFPAKKIINTLFDYLYDYKIKPLSIMLLKRSTYVKNYDAQTKRMYFLIEDDNLLKKFNII